MGDPIRGVLFDLDETLNDRSLSLVQYIRLLSDPCRGLLLPCDVTAIHRWVCEADRRGYRPKDEFFPELCSRLPWKNAPTAKAMAEHWRENFYQCIVARNGAVDLLRRLRNKGMRLGIVTNGCCDSQTAKIKTLGMEPLVDAVIISEGVGCTKPDPRIFNLALEAIGTTAKQTLFVGDNARTDICGATQAGMRTAWLNLGSEYPPDVNRADFQICGLEELCAIASL